MVVGEPVVEVRWLVDPVALLTARMDAGLSLREAGELCGWTSQYHGRLEVKPTELSTESVRKLVEAFPVLELPQVLKYPRFTLGRVTYSAEFAPGRLDAR